VKGESGPIQAEYQRLAAKRDPVLKRARLCASLVGPGILPRENQTQDNELTENWQSIGSRGLDARASAFMFVVYPLNLPWGKLKLPPRLAHAENADPEQLRAVNDQLLMVELVARAKLEQSYMRPQSNRRHVGFRTVKRQTIKQVLATGDALSYIDDDYRLRLYRRDKYVTVRNDAGDVLMHIVCEQVDPLDVRIRGMSRDEVLAAANLKAPELEKKKPDERMMDLFTQVSWNSDRNRWVIEQELNGKTIRTADEPVTPFLSTTYDLLPGENYGRGFIENKLGDLSMLDKSSQRLAEIAARAARSITVVSPDARITPEKLEDARNGEILAGSVRAAASGNVVEGIAQLESVNIPETGVLAQYVRELRLELGKAFGLELDLQPRGDRVTATQVLRVASAVNDQTDGMLPSYIEQEHTPLMQRVVYMLQRDMPGLVPDMPEDAELEITTGLAAMTREQDIERLTNAVQYLTALGLQDRINVDEIAAQLLNMLGMQTDKIIKTAEQQEAEQVQQTQNVAREAAAQEAVSVVGDAARAGFEQQNG